jgi:hypothetical protein
MCEDRLPSELLGGLLACLGMPDILDSPVDTVKVTRLVDAFEWLADLRAETIPRLFVKGNNLWFEAVPIRRLWLRSFNGIRDEEICHCPNHSG